MAFIEVTGVSKSFGTRRVLGDVSLSVEHGEFVSIVGAMGSGKSTLLSILAGLTSADAGTVTIDGEPVRGIRPDGAFVFQNYSLLPWFTALENVRLAVEAAFPKLSRDEQRAKARTMLEKVGLGNALNRRPRQLSGGMRQRVAIARALATDPKVLFLDEPLGALDALTRETLQTELARLCAPSTPLGASPSTPLGASPSTPLGASPSTSLGASDGDQPVTTIMITNSVEEAILLSDRIVPILPGPPATLGAAIEVALPRPRSAAQLAHDEQATHVRSHVVATLTAALGMRVAKRSAAGAAGATVLNPVGEPR